MHHQTLSWARLTRDERDSRLLALGLGAETLEVIRSRRPRERILRAAKLALTVDEEPNSDLIEYIAGYAPRSAVYHYFRSMAELIDCVGRPRAQRSLSKIVLHQPYLDLASTVPTTAENSDVHMENAENSNQFIVWQKVNGGMRTVVLNRLIRRVTFLCGILLYAGEGTKSLTSSRVELANSNPGILRLHINFMSALGIPAKRLIARVQIHRADERLEAETLWSRELGLGSAQFAKPLLSPTSPAKHRRTFTLQIGYSNTMLLVLLRHWTNTIESLVEGLDE